METARLYELFKKAGQVSTDSRNADRGAIFFALKGENFNGNIFAADALKKGCSMAVVDEPEYAVDNRYIVVDDTLGSLQELAEYHRKTLNAKIIAITGTNGKTTTKELTAALLANRFDVVATRGNLNNHIGVPLTLLEMDRSTSVGIVEMGANHTGEIASLCSLAKPGLGLITNIGTAHLEGFGSPQNVIKAKSELYIWLRKNNGIIFQNADDRVLKSLPVGGASVIQYSEKAFSDIRATPILEFTWHSEGVARRVETQLFGKYNMQNIAAAIAVAGYMGVPAEDISQALENYTPGNMRSQIVEAGNNIIVLDAYNANPTSMRVAITSFIENNTGRKVIILGDMLELGKYSESEHKKIADLLKGVLVDLILLVGPQFCAAAGNGDAKCFSTTDELGRFLRKNPISDSNILLKGSRGMQLEKLLPFLQTG